MKLPILDWRIWLELTVAALLGVVVAIGIDGMGIAVGQGSANVDFEFKVVDAVTGKPIKGAVIEFEGFDYQWLPPEELVTDADGVAHYQFANMETTSRQGMLGIRNERTAHFSQGVFRVSAPDHIQSGPLPTTAQRRSLRVHSTGNQSAKASLQIELTPSGSTDRKHSSGGS